MAATTLSGFLQCSFLSMDAEMQAHFEALCKTRVPKRKRRELGSAVDTIPSAGKEDGEMGDVFPLLLCGSLFFFSLQNPNLFSLGVLGCCVSVCLCICVWLREMEERIYVPVCLLHGLNGMA